MVDFSQIKASLPEYKVRIQDSIKRELYLHDRYGTDFSALMIYSDEPINTEVFSAHIRESDSVIVLDENFVLIIYDIIDIEKCSKAAQNLLLSYQRYDIQQPLYMAVAPARQKNSSTDIGTRLFMILEYAFNESLKNRVIDMEEMLF
jgi:hypothetical protein